MAETRVDAALAASAPMPLWLDSAERPEPRPPLDGEVHADLVVVGGGFTGLWSALRAKERDPDCHVVLVEADRIAEHATGRNGGFCEASLTHGALNGRRRWPEEYDVLDRLGRENLDAIEASLSRYGIDCGFQRRGVLAVATRPHEVAALDDGSPGFLDGDAVRAALHSPTYLAGRLARDECATLDPARLAWGLARAAESLGVVIAEQSPVTSLERAHGRVRVRLPRATVDARHVVLATNAFTSLLGWRRLLVVPVYDHVLATEPLTPAQVDSVGWHDRFGVADSGNQFHYYRLTPDDRILWGGYDAVYHYGRSIDPAHEERPETFRVLAQHFFETFPQLAGLHFTHRWAGVIDTCTRFCAFFGLTQRGRVAYAAGFTGLGVGASRFAADVMLDLLSGAATERTRLAMVRRRPLPFPTEPFAWVGITLTRWSMAREDRTGRRNPWLRLLDRCGLGFDS